METVFCSGINKQLDADHIFLPAHRVRYFDGYTSNKFLAYIIWSEAIESTVQCRQVWSVETRHTDGQLEIRIISAKPVPGDAVQLIPGPHLFCGTCGDDKLVPIITPSSSNFLSFLPSFLPSFYFLCKS